MVSISEQIKDAIQVVSHQRTVFTAGDIAAYANLEGAEKSICEVLRREYGEFLNLDSTFSTGPNEERYIWQFNVERWWVRQTLRWADSGIDYLTEGQLANAMSLAFDECRWSTPPEAILQVGRRWAIVAEGCMPGTYVFPWASALRANPQLADTFKSILDPRSEVARLKNELDGTYHQYQWRRLMDDEVPVHLSQSAIISATNQALDILSEREAYVIKGRFGFDAGHKATLEELGVKFGVTRERIRQIEKKALKKLKGLPVWYCGFVVHTILSGGSLLISKSEITPQWELFSTSIGLKMVFIPELGLHVLGTSDGLLGYQEYLKSHETISKISDRESENCIFEELRFLSRQDAAHLSVMEREYLDSRRKYLAEQAVRTLPLMLLQALRYIGRAAHYQEIAEVCNRMYPDRQMSIRNWHAALCRPDSLELGIVWIGRRGTYGLEEQGYSRPPRDLFEAAASIVEARYTETGQPVPYDFVLRELSRERQDPDPSSVNIALSINERLISMGQGRYVPAAHATAKPLDAVPSRYDFDAGFAAFRSGDDDV